jgi:hypothetical protein
MCWPEPYATAESFKKNKSGCLKIEGVLNE